MRDAAGELTDRLQLLGLEQTGLRILPGGHLLVDAPLQVGVHQFKVRIGLVQGGGALGDAVVEIGVGARQRLVGDQQLFGKRPCLLERDGEFLVHRAARPFIGLLPGQHLQRIGQAGPQVAGRLLGRAPCREVPLIRGSQRVTLARQRYDLVMRVLDRYKRLLQFGAEQCHVCLQGLIG